jgi:carotenoid cleavage dioxygenase
MAGGPALKWSPDNGTRLGVLPRRGGADDIVWHDIDTCYIVHFFNAWEDDGRIEIRAPRFSAMPGGFEFDHPTGREAPVPWRWSLDLASGQVTHEQTDDRPGEFPRVNDDHATRATRYLYNATARSWELEFEFNGVVKYDLHTGAVQSYEYGDTEVSGEHVFAPDPERTDEDAGWLLTMVADRATDTSFLSVLDATDLGAGPVAKVRIPCRVPLGFHANWFADR